MAPEFTDRDREPEETEGRDDTSDALEEGRSGPVEGALDVIDRSIGMYLLRRLTGRSTDDASESDAPVVLTADQIAYRIGVADATPPAAPDPTVPPTPLVAGTAATAAAARAAATARVAPRSLASPAEAGPELDRLTRGRTAAATSRAAPAPRERLVRDSGVALLALALVGLVAVVFWPQGGPNGEPTGSVFVVNRAPETPEPSDGLEAPSAAATGEVAVETDTPVATPGATPQDTPKPPAVVTPPTARPASHATPRPAATPTRRPTPKPTPKPTATPGSTPSPTPDSTPEPTPSPTPSPTPTPTPDPTSTPDPTPSPYGPLRTVA